MTNEELERIRQRMEEARTEAINGLETKKLVISAYDVPKLLDEIESLKKKLKAKIVFLNNGWEEERYALQEEIERLRWENWRIRKGHIAVLQGIRRQTNEPHVAELIDACIREYREGDE